MIGSLVKGVVLKQSVILRGAFAPRSQVSSHACAWERTCGGNFIADPIPSIERSQREMKFRGNKKRSQVKLGSEEPLIRRAFSVNRPRACAAGRRRKLAAVRGTRSFAPRLGSNSTCNAPVANFEIASGMGADPRVPSHDPDAATVLPFSPS